MPSSITHAYLAMDIYEILDKKVKQKFSKQDVENYKTYSQGPDIYYFYKILLPFSKEYKKVSKFGSYIHNHKVNELFLNLTEKVKISKDFQQFLFLIGLVTHYVTDSTIHPYINYKSKLMVSKHLSKKDTHFILETYIDNYMILKKGNLDYKNFKVGDFCFNLKESNEVKELIDISFHEVFNKKNMGECYYKSFKNMKTFFKVLRYDKISLKKYFYKLCNVIAKRYFRDVRYLSYHFNLDKNDLYLNLNHELWYNIDDKRKTSEDSFLDLYSKVIIETKYIIEKLYEYIYENKITDLEQLFGNKSYSNGLLLK